MNDKNTNVLQIIRYPNGELTHWYAFTFMLNVLGEVFDFVKLNHFEAIPSINCLGKMYYTVLLEYICGNFNNLSNLLLSVAGFLRIDKLLR